MNQHLQNILNIIQQDENVSAEQKSSIAKSLKDADKELEITAFKLERTEKVKKTTAILLEETIEELEQKRRSVEAQNRELEIESALEKVRTAAMAMNSRTDMINICRIIMEQLTFLKVTGIRNVQTAIFDDVNRVYANYEYYSHPEKEIVTIIPFESHPVRKEFATRMMKGPGEIYEHSFKGEEIRAWVKAQERVGEYVDPNLFEAENLDYYWYSLGPVAMGVSAYRPLHKEEIQLFIRFKNVFELSYRRYLDIEKAAAQAREAQIEAALERVRAKVMVMKSSNELNETSLVFGEQLIKLGIDWQFSYFWLIEEDKDDNTFWITWPDKKTSTTVYSLAEADENFRECIIAWKEQVKIHISHVPKEGVQDWLDTFERITQDAGGQALEIMQAKNFKTGVYYYDAMIRFGSFGLLINRELTEEEMNIQVRFATEFERAYTRFNDLKQAEAQARESEIQLALERVRARTMAMQKSDELPQAANLLFQQVQSLGMPAWSAGYCTWDEDKRAITLSMSSEGVLQPTMRMPLTEDPSLIHFREAHERGETFFVEEVGGEELKRHYAYLRTLPGVKETLDDIEKAGFPVPTFQIFHLAYFSKGFLLFITYEPVPEAWDIFKRFAAVFEQTYTRFLDLQKAEIQTKEAQIETSLERIRSRAMAMHSSNELGEAAILLYRELQSLGITQFINCGYVLIDEINNTQYAWMTHADGTIREAHQMPLTGDSVMDIRYENWKRKVPIFRQVVGGKQLKDHLVFVSGKTLTEEGTENVIPKLPDPTVFYCGNFSEGYLHILSNDVLSKESEIILSRFTMVFEITYRRFRDLQKAEAQAREAQIELSLERVRARTMAMHKSDELVDTSVILFQELRSLGVKAIRTGVAIIDDEKEIMELWSSQLIEQKQNKVLGIVPMQSHPFFKGLLNAWRKKDHEFTFELTGEKVKEFYETMSSLISYPDRDSYNPREVFSPFFFPEGSLTVVSHEPLTNEERSIMQRFARVFGLLYRRFLDLQRAEAQAREAQIEAALERVRSRTMGMQKSEELKEVIQVVYEQFVHLNIHIEHTGFIMDYKERDDMHIWLADRHAIPFQVTIPYFDCAHWNSFREAKEKGRDFFVNQLAFEEKNRFYEDLFKLIPGLPEEAKEYYLSCPGLAISTVLLENVGLYIENFSGIPYTDEENNTLMRFGKVFQQTYTRFLDLQKSEAQARESQIQLALERVRSRTMAMHKSEELTEVAGLLFQQVNNLGIKTWTTGFNVWSDDDNYYTDYITNPQGGFIEPYTIDAGQYPVFKKVSDAKKGGADFFIQYEEGEQLRDTYRQLGKFGDSEQFEKLLNDGFRFPSQQYEHFVFGSKVSLMFITYEPVTEAHDIFRRFGKVFEQTYTRFLDLQKAEAQAREAQVELGLERVRARAMAMQKPEELRELIGTVFTELTKLDLALTRCIIMIYDGKTDGSTWWMANSEAPANPIGLVVQNHKSPPYLAYLKAWKDKEVKWQYVLEGTVKKEWDDFLFVETELSHLPDFVIAGMKAPELVYLNASFNSFGNLTLATLEPLTNEHFDIMLRFAKVFDLTYTRFLDLQKAEAQAREAEIELALERVRARTLAMQHSTELAETAAVLFEQFNLLGTEPERIAIEIVNEKENVFEIWATEHGGKKLNMSVKCSLDEPHVMQPMYKAWKEQKKSITIDLQGKVLEEYFEYLNNQKLPVQREIFGKRRVQNVATFSKGILTIITPEPRPQETIMILERFASVFDGTYTRFLDLQKAEAQAREANIEASLERVRSKAMAMHSTEDLAATIGAFYRELQSFSITPRRCGVGLLNKETRDGELFTWNTTEKGESLELVGKIKMEGHPVLNNVYEHWLKQQEYHPVLRGNEIKEYYKVVRPQMAFPDYDHDVIQYGYFFFFDEGGVYAWTGIEMGEEELKIYRRFSSVLSLTYKRYKDLQQAESLARKAEQDLVLLKEEKKRTEEALAELQVTQKQLVQSEKMASLGELTAGIAHEIQNPLNFVNNFSEVSNELIDEMVEEVEKGNYEEVKAIANDVKQNLEKINHHGKRADGIVKGMLQHSRSSSGQKEPTDINVLTDEYLRLAYHGLRAKDKTFNALMKTDYDERIGNISVIPQDIGRVILNLINNAFYAVSERKKINLKDYEPLVTVITKKIKDRAEIRVRDNGNGIPGRVLDKIFQPFFTTKPTGQGTGLGLSLSYDIVKAHGGELTVDTKEGEGSEFIIQLPV